MPALDSFMGRCRKTIAPKVQHAKLIHVAMGQSRHIVHAPPLPVFTQQPTYGCIALIDAPGH
jgi:hypothetical protein